MVAAEAARARRRLFVLGALRFFSVVCSHRKPKTGNYDRKGEKKKIIDLNILDFKRKHTKCVQINVDWVDDARDP